MQLRFTNRILNLFQCEHICPQRYGSHHAAFRHSEPTACCRCLRSWRWLFQDKHFKFVEKLRQNEYYTWQSDAGSVLRVQNCHVVPCFSNQSAVFVVASNHHQVSFERFHFSTDHGRGSFVRQKGRFAFCRQSHRCVFHHWGRASCSGAVPPPRCWRETCRRQSVGHTGVRTNPILAQQTIHSLRMYTLEEMLMPDEILLGNFNSIFLRSHVFLNPQNHFPIIGLAGVTQQCFSVVSSLLLQTLFAGMSLSFDGFNDYLRIAHEELVFPSQVRRVLAPVHARASISETF
jgi:hypothetical protein